MAALYSGSTNEDKVIIDLSSSHIRLVFAKEKQGKFSVKHVRATDLENASDDDVSSD